MEKVNFEKLKEIGREILKTVEHDVDESYYIQVEGRSNLRGEEIEIVVNHFPKYEGVVKRFDTKEEREQEDNILIRKITFIPEEETKWFTVMQELVHRSKS